MSQKSTNTAVVSAVVALHLLLAWGIAQIPLHNLEFEEVGNLQMVEVNLGVEAPAPPSEPEPIPEPEPEPPPPPPQQEIVTTEVKNEPVDIMKEPPKPKEKPKPKKEPPKPKEKVEKKPQTKPAVAQQSAKKSEKVTASTATDQPIGNPKGIAGSQSTQGNSSVSASLGAGFGRAMRGKCSDISDEADDEGTVGLKVTISESGKASEVEVISSSGIKRLDNQAKRMASGHTYSPAKANGKPTVGSVTFNIVFKCGAAA